MEPVTKTTHPLILIAATSVTVASLAAAAHFTGLLPSRSEVPAAPVAPVAAVTAPTAAPTAPQAKPEQAPVAHESSRPAAKPRVQRHTEEAPQPVRRADTDNTRRNEDWRYQSGTQRVSTNAAGIDVIPSSSAPAARPAPAQENAVAPPVCRECGTVESVREVVAKGEGSPLGAIAGGVLGGVLGNQVGRGTGKDLATIAGAVGGAFAGHEVEKNVRTTKQYQVEVRFDDGAVRTYTQPAPNWRSGDRVRLSNGNLAAITYADR